MGRTVFKFKAKGKSSGWCCCLPSRAKAEVAPIEAQINDSDATEMNYDINQSRQLDSTFEIYPGQPPNDWEELSDRAQREIEEELRRLDN